jgi:hypothetical protein
MGFEPQETLYKLRWEDPAMAGLEVTVREPSIDQMMTMTGMDVPGARKISPAQFRVVFELFAGLLDSWNVTRKGEPVPPTYEGVTSQTPAFITKIIAAVGEEFAKPDPTLPAGSSAGETSGLESSIPMTPSLPSPGS